MISHTIAAQVYTMNTAYDTFSRVSDTTYPSGFAVNNVYSSHGDLLEVRDAANDTVFWAAGNQNARGQATQYRLGSGLSTVKSFDSEGMPTLITTGFGTGSAVQNQAFAYDVHGNLMSRTDFNQMPPSGTGNLVETFTYDTLFRLESATLTGIGVRSFSYDALGNITSKTGVGNYTYGTGISGTTQAGPHAVKTAGGVPYTYDANGNQISGDGRTLTYASFNKAKTISKGGQTYSFEYGSDRFRTRQTGPGFTTVYLNPRLDLGAHYEQETRNGQIKDKHYIYGGSGLVAVHTQQRPVSDVIDSLSPNVGKAFLTNERDLAGRLVSSLSKAEFASLKQAPGYFTGETGLLGILAKLVPGFNSSAVLHDAAYGQFQRAVGFAQGGRLDGILLLTTIPPVFAGNVVALGVPQIVDNARLVDDDVL